MGLLYDVDVNKAYNTFKDVFGQGTTNSESCSFRRLWGLRRDQLQGWINGATLLNLRRSIKRVPKSVQFPSILTTLVSPLTRFLLVPITAPTHCTSTKQPVLQLTDWWLESTIEPRKWRHCPLKQNLRSFAQTYLQNTWKQFWWSEPP